MTKIFLALLICLCGTVAQAEESTSDHANSTSVSEETDWGSLLFSQSLDGSGSLGARPDKDPPWTWNLGYEFAKTTTPNGSLSTIVDKANSFTGGLSWLESPGWGLGLALDYSKTPAESLTSRGGVVTLTRAWKAGSPKEKGKGEEGFARTFSLDFNLGTNLYSEKYAGNTLPRRKLSSRPTAGTVNLRQDMIGIDANCQPLEGWEFSLGAKDYSFNRNVANFQNNLDSPAAVRSGRNAFSGTLGGLAKADFTAGIKWDFAEDWSNSLSESLSILAIGRALDSNLKNLVGYQFADAWKASAGVEYETSVVETGWIGIFGVEWIH